MSADTIRSAGTTAAEVTRETTPDQSVASSDFRGRRAILAFDPGDGRPGHELDIFNERLSDCEPKGEVARAYGVYDATGGTSARALFGVDRGGAIAGSHLGGVLDAVEMRDRGTVAPPRQEARS